MNIEDILSILTNDITITIAVLALIVSVISGWISIRISLKALKTNQEQLKAAQKSLTLQKRQYYFGKSFTKGERITDGSLQLKFLKVNFLGPSEDEGIFEDLMLRSAIEASLTIENNSISDAIVENLAIVPTFSIGESRLNWFIRFLRLILRLRDEGEVIISLRDQEITSIWGSTAMELDKLLVSWRGYFRGKDSLKHAWKAIMYIDTGKQISFDGSTIIPHDGRKRKWKLEFSFEPEFYRELLTKYAVFFSGIKIVIVTDLGNLWAHFEYDDIRVLAQISL